MKTIIYTTMLGMALFFQVQGQAQTILNNDLNDWTPSGNPAPFDWEEPTDWKSANSLTEWVSAGVGKTTDAYSGSYACQLVSLNISGGWPSVICNGTPNLMGSAFGDPSVDIITGGTPISSKPNTLMGYYKFDNNNPLDSGYAVVILKKFNTSQNKYDTVGMGDFLFPEASNYTPFEITINDLMASVTPDSIVIAFYSTNPKNPNAPIAPSIGLIVDSLSLGFDPTSVNKQKESRVEPVLYPNPTSNVLVIEWEGSKMYEMRLYNVLGQSVKVIVGQGKTKLDVSEFPKGQYFLRITEQNNSDVFTKSFMVN